MAKKRNTRPHLLALHTEEDSQGRLKVMLSETLRKDRELMRWLHHRVVDLLDDINALYYLDDELDERLSLLTVDVTSDYIENLLVEGRAAVEQGQQEEDGQEAGEQRGEQEDTSADGNGRFARKGACHEKA